MCTILPSINNEYNTINTIRLARYDFNQEIVAGENFKIPFFQEVYYS